MQVQRRDDNATKMNRQQNFKHAWPIGHVDEDDSDDADVDVDENMWQTSCMVVS